LIGIIYTCAIRSSIARARPRKEILEDLYEELRSDKISKMRPLGQSLEYRLDIIIIYYLG
jgi:hypothetical protein